jgi:hypothetical protein
MKPHIKIYLDYFQIGMDDKIKGEIPDCLRIIQQVHHITGRGKGRDTINNLIGICLFHHDQIHFRKNNKLSKEKLWEIHQEKLYPQDRIDYKKRDKLFALSS